MRKEDPDSKIYFRSGDRFFRIENRWWFTTRDGDHGPYATRERAEAALRQFLDGVELLDKHQKRVARDREATRRGDPSIWNKLNS